MATTMIRTHRRIASLPLLRRTVTTTTTTTTGLLPSPPEDDPTSSSTRDRRRRRRRAPDFHPPPPSSADRRRRAMTTTSSSSSSSSPSMIVPFYGVPLPPSSRYRDPAADPSSSDHHRQHRHHHHLPPLTPSQRLATLFHSSISAIRDPTRHDAVAAVGELVGTYALSRMMNGMMSNDVGRRVMRDRPVVDGNTVVLASASTSSSSISEDVDDTTTFGMAYASFLERHSFDPEHRTIVRYVSDPDLAYVATRYRQCHDYWHVLSGLPPTVLGEAALKALELVQTGMPLSALSVMASMSSYTGLLDDGERHELRMTYLPWAIRVGRNMREHVLMSTYYELEFGTDLNVLRDRMGIEVAPIVES